jgi:thiamine-monophosphate kinase
VANIYIGDNLPLPEKALIAGIRLRSRGKGRGIALGIGDDCAVLQVPANRQVLVTTDFSLEGIHFRREWHPADSVGHRCLARGLSDIAAMGGEPLAAFLSLALPRKLSQRWADQFLSGLLTLANEFHVPLAGGDIAESLQGVLADIVVVGSVPRGRAILRSSARPGDRIYVTGQLGGSAYAVSLLLSGKRRRLDPRDYRSHFYPQPRIAVGRVLGEHKLASAMIDISDGLSTDLLHICEESGVGAEILADAIPRAQVGPTLQEVDLQTALHGGEAYELLFCARPEKTVPGQIDGVTVSEIGRMTRGSGMVLRDRKGAKRKLRAQGWEHFRS